jgi:6-pyruvoyltetrahydropterin/6-carboxytetrahydropterin synthase
VAIRNARYYRLVVVVRRDDLDERGMVVDLDVLERALRYTAAPVADADLDAVLPPDTGPVTVEVFARWVHGELTAALGRLPTAALAVRVCGERGCVRGYTAPLDGSSSS